MFYIPSALFISNEVVMGRVDSVVGGQNLHASRITHLVTSRRNHKTPARSKLRNRHTLPLFIFFSIRWNMKNIRPLSPHYRILPAFYRTPPGGSDGRARDDTVTTVDYLRIPSRGQDLNRLVDISSRGGRTND